MYASRLLAAGLARIAHKAELTNVVLASVDSDVAAWLRPCWLLTLDAAGVPTLRHSPQRAPAAARRQSAGVNIRYDENNYDSGDATPAVDPVRARVCRLCSPKMYSTSKMYYAGARARLLSRRHRHWQHGAEGRRELEREYDYDHV